jgi:uncharacterized membrane protein YbhN (UPF0104 family)
MPSSVGGDLLKAWYVTKHTDKRVEGALSVLVDRLVGLFGMVLMAIGAYLLFLRGQSIEGGEDPKRGLGLSLGAYRSALLWSAAMIGAAVVALLLYPRTRVAIWRIGGRITVRGAALLRRAWTAAVVYWSKPVTMLLSFLLTVVAQSVVVAGFWLLGRNLGLDAEVKHYFVVFPVSWVVAAIPVSIAGLGVLEAGLVTLFTSLTAATGEGALALALCQRFVWVLVSLPGGGVHLLGGHLPSEFLVDERNTVN